MHADTMEINECRHTGLELIPTYQTTTLSAPRGVTMSAGAKEYATKFNISPKITVGRRERISLSVIIPPMSIQSESRERHVDAVPHSFFFLECGVCGERVMGIVAVRDSSAPDPAQSRSILSIYKKRALTHHHACPPECGPEVSMSLASNGTTS